MLKQFKFNTNKRPLFVTADTHFGHNRAFVYEKRGFKSIQEHDAELIFRWNKVVTPDSDVLHLGDFALNSTKEQVADYLNLLNGHIYFLWGNHNSGIKQLYRESIAKVFSQDWIEVYPWIWNDKLTFCGRYMWGWVDKTPFVASHFSHRIWDYMQHGAILLSGHSHGTDEESNPNCINGKRLDVGIDNFGRPISFSEVMEIMNKKQIIQHDHHNKETSSSF